MRFSGKLFCQVIKTYHRNNLRTKALINNLCGLENQLRGHSGSKEWTKVASLKTNRPEVESKH